jgi:hypothetical protein
MRSIAAAFPPHPKGPRLWGVVAQYDTTKGIYHACERVRDAGYTRWDTCVPFAVHGLDKAMGLKPTILPWIVLAVGLAGFVFGIGFQTWAMADAYPMVVGGKPLFSIPAFVPVWYEITVLSSCLTAFFGNWFLSRLPMLYYPAFKVPAFARCTDDKFFIVIEARDPLFDVAKVKAMLNDTGAALVQEVED